MHTASGKQFYLKPPIRSTHRAMNLMSHLLLPIILLLVMSSPCLCRSQAEPSLTLKPPTPEKEVFMGDSFVITCLANEPASSEFKLRWLNPDGKEVPSVPTSPVYVSEKQDGLQIVFLRHHKRHSGVYKCVKERTDSGAQVASIDFRVKIYKSIEFTGPSSTEAVEGDSHYLVCTVKFDPDVTSASVIWDKTGKNIVNENSDKYRVSETRPPTTKSTLMISKVEKTDAGDYTCRATQFSSTISQFKQHEIKLKVNYRPKFTLKTIGGAWIDRREVAEHGKKVIDVDFVCEVEAEPRAEFMWHDENQRRVSLDANNPTQGVIDIVTEVNRSILKYRYNVTGKEVEPSSTTGRWPPPGTNYRSPQRPTPAVVNQPNVQFECRVRNAIGTDSKRFNLQIGDLPVAPSVISHSYNGSELTLVLRQTPTSPPVDFYRLEFKNGVNVDFNAQPTASSSDTGSRGQAESDGSSNNVTYTVALDNVPSGNHQIVIYAHNPVGWSNALRSGINVKVVNRAGHKVQASLAVIFLSLIPALLFTVSGRTIRA